MGTTVIYTTHDSKTAVLQLSFNCSSLTPFSVQIAGLADKVYEIDSDGKLVLIEKLPSISTSNNEAEDTSISDDPMLAKAGGEKAAENSSAPKEVSDDQSNRSSEAAQPSTGTIIRDRDVYIRYFQSIGIVNTVVALGGGLIFAFTFKFPGMPFHLDLVSQNSPC